LKQVSLKLVQVQAKYCLKPNCIA